MAVSMALQPYFKILPGALPDHHSICPDHWGQD